MWAIKETVVKGDREQTKCKIEKNKKGKSVEIEIFQQMIHNITHKQNTSGRIHFLFYHFLLIIFH